MANGHTLKLIAKELDQTSVVRVRVLGADLLNAKYTPSRMNAFDGKKLALQLSACFLKCTH